MDVVVTEGMAISLLLRANSMRDLEYHPVKRLVH